MAEVVKEKSIAFMLEIYSPLTFPSFLQFPSLKFRNLGLQDGIPL